ncbi:2-oxoacid:acceptor oxidoreductase family protein [Sporomusa acidovorans]|uniref:Pyruvate synthase subunit PorC n=1 Tax=Sporomusa acidovorans (strain ATCC 49682 / DSM 3132 / Mol) TaxID=1123286 RepID=A0ABZ3IYM3_SPOA4|nr:2-oxoacid:acceptor oxidoreductase family protein [Sporomusa acidovorans]SDE14135.1 2-oxoglutarate ferredoxin oxidoreductase subunit gamma [Sporomusa acidovorans]
MRHEMIMAGFGGQGVLLMGQILTYAGMLEGKRVSWIPSYGPEMRGGTANCSVIITEGATGSPMVEEPTAAVVLNLPSLDKFEPAIRENGVLIVNSSLIDKEVKRQDIKVYRVPVNDIASELGNIKMANMVALGALIAATGAVEMEMLFTAFAKKFAAKPHILEPNQVAINRGYYRVKNSM